MLVIVRESLRVTGLAYSQVERLELAVLIFIIGSYV